MGTMSSPKLHIIPAATPLSLPPPPGQMPVGVWPLPSVTNVPLRDNVLFASLQPRHCDHVLCIAAHKGSPHCRSLMGPTQQLTQ